MNLLDRLITNENSMTEALAGLLTYKIFRDVFVAMIAKEPCQSLDEDHVETQMIITDCGIPDLIIKNDEITILVEVKCSKSRALTDNQPESYLKWLSKQSAKDKFFILLAPSGYKHMDEYKSRLKKKSELKGIETKEIDWADILRLIEENGLDELNQNFRDFSSVLRSWFIQEPISLNRKELEVIYNSETTAAIEKLIKIVDDVISYLDKEYDVPISKSRRWWEDGEYGCYLMRNKKDILWFGIWTALWQEHGVPISLGADKNWEGASHVKQFRVNHPDCKDYEGYYYLKVEKDILESEESVQKIIDIIEKALGSC
jgi:hypothetical protein